MGTPSRACIWLPVIVCRPKHQRPDKEVQGHTCCSWLLIQACVMLLLAVGGVSIEIFGIQLSREQPLPREVRPRMGLLLDAFIELMGEYGQQGGQPKLRPFWLPIRWTEPDMTVEQVRQPTVGACPAAVGHLTSS